MNRRLIPLTDDRWHFGAVRRQPWDRELSADRGQVDRWRPATVPGNVRSDLLALGEIADPFFGTQNEASAWVDDRDWWYVRELNLAPQPGERVHLVCEGIDYRCAVFFDDRLLARHEGMFSRQVYDLTPFLAPSPAPHALAVRIFGSNSLPLPALSRGDRLWAPLASRLQGSPAFPDRIATVKCQMSFGWDFAPRMRTMGIWDDAYLVVSRGVFLADAWVEGADLSPERATARVHLTLDADEARPVQVVAVVAGENFDGPQPLRFTRHLELQAGPQEIVWDLPIESPRLWNPWDRGEPHLYCLTVALFEAATAPEETQPLDSTSLTFGLRSVRLARNPDTPADHKDWTFVVNDQPTFVRGANWVPIDSLPGRARRADYEALIGMARDVGVNMFRVWGGGLREKADFYDLCDRAGILVWQEFPLACAFLDHLPRDAGFRDLLGREAAGIVRGLRGHPSLVLWCGGNEFGVPRNRALVETLRAVVAEHDGTRPFHEASPARGDSHNWRVWHGFAPFSEYQEDQTQFASEFGLQAAPDARTLRECLPPADLWPPGPAWTYHRAELAKLDRYAPPFMSPIAPAGLPSSVVAAGLESIAVPAGPQSGADSGPLGATRDRLSLDEYVGATQRAQAYALQVAIEHHRRRKYRCSGVMFWQFNDPWPAISWSVVDYYRRPKLAYRKLSQFYSPVLVSLEYPLRKYQPGESFEACVWLINDLLEPQEDCALCVALDGVEVHRAEGLVLPPDSCRREAPMVSCVLPAEGPWLLRAELCQGEGVIAVSEYDLRYHDEQTVRWDVRVRSRIGEWVMER